MVIQGKLRAAKDEHFTNTSTRLFALTLRHLPCLLPSFNILIVQPLSCDLSPSLDIDL